MKTLVNCYQSSKDELTHIYIENGESFRDVINFKPILGYRTTENPTKGWTDLFGNTVKVRQFDSISEMRIFKKENEQNFDILGDVRPHVQFMAMQYPNDIVPDTKHLKIWNFDIETIRDRDDPTQQKGFPKPEDTPFPIVTIAFQDMATNKYIELGYKEEYYPQDDNVEFILCKDEQDLIKTFIKIYQQEKPHILTGFNISKFDIPYIVNRTLKVLGKHYVTRLSLDGKVKKITVDGYNGSTEDSFMLQGVIIWDFLELYKKYIGEPRENFTLDYISQYELGMGKVSYTSDHESLEDLYYDDYQKFCYYNKVDVERVSDLNNKLKFIELAFSIMVKAKCSPEVIFKTLEPWDCIFYNELLKQKKLCPSQKINPKENYPGGFVQDPEVGLHEWVMVYDIVSSYPNQIRSFNMSPETIIDDKHLPDELLEIKKKFNDVTDFIDIDNLASVQSTLEKYQVTLTAAGYFFRTDIDGFVADIYSKIFNERVEFKKLVKSLAANGQKEESGQMHLKQYAIKILLNSGYGAIANEYSRYHDLRIAKSITLCGQLSTRGSMKYLKDHLDLTSIYGDTDSFFLDLYPTLQKRFPKGLPDKARIVDFLLKFSENIIEPKCDEFFDKMTQYLNTRQSTIKMEPECISEASLFLAKKKYFMMKTWDEGKFYLDKPKEKIRGIEIIRTSTPQFVRDKLKEAMGLIFSTKSNESVLYYINKVKKEFFNLPFEDIAFPRGANFSEYNINSKALPIQIRGCFVYNKLLKETKLEHRYTQIYNGDKIKFCYIKVPNKIGSNVIAISKKFPEEWLDIIKPDYETQWEKTFMSPIYTIFDTLGWKANDNPTLEDFFA